MNLQVAINRQKRILGGLSGLRVALVHYWYVRRRGGERVLEVLAGMFPQADIFMLLHDPGALAAPLKSHRITSSFLQKFPYVKRYYRSLLPPRSRISHTMDLEVRIRTPIT